MAFGRSLMTRVPSCCECRSCFTSCRFCTALLRDCNPMSAVTFSDARDQWWRDTDTLMNSRRSCKRSRYASVRIAVTPDMMTAVVNFQGVFDVATEQPALTRSAGAELLMCLSVRSGRGRSNVQPSANCQRGAQHFTNTSTPYSHAVNLSCVRHDTKLL
jgi:hypothetical protein